MNFYIGRLQKNIHKYKAKIKTYETCKCFGCEGKCSSCIIGKQIHGLECNIAYCEQELARAKYGSEMEKRRKM